ncbi:MAG: M20/M25/M40 family metallo-hydrolase [Actinomycetota bacterium]|nr:M20/M25/M40 family metallo-hydrolase [Actinomycetota bacterium]
MTAIASFTDQVWDDDILPTLTDYIRIPALSPAFDPDWATSGHLDAAVAMLSGWAEARSIDGLSVEVVRMDGRTPVILAEVPAFDGGGGGGASGADTVLLYGHLDKQPEMVGWRDGLGPWEPVRDGDRLYGRGGADDGYALFAALAAIEAARAEGRPHARCVILIEATEESGSYDLPAYVEALAPRIGDVSLIICLDSGAMNYHQLWVTNSLRGLASGLLRVEVNTEGLHSGAYGGIVPDSFRVLRGLLDRIEDSATGEVLVPECHTEIPADRVAQVEGLAAALGDFTKKYPVVDGVDLATKAPAELWLDRTWRPSLTVIGADGFPSTAAGGNVIRPGTSMMLSMRLPPTVDPDVAAEAIGRVLTEDPPYGAKVTWELRETGPGWAAPTLAPWLAEAADAASNAHFGSPCGHTGEGGSIPFMGMLGERFPEAQFLVIGVLGPGSNAHGPNEFLHVPMAKKLTACVADVLAAHATR